MYGKEAGSLKETDRVEEIGGDGHKKMSVTVPVPDILE